MDPDEVVGDDADLGEPIAELRDLEEVPSAGFLGRLRNSLRRRALGAQVATLSWTGLATVVVEFIRVIFSIFETNQRDEGGAD